MICSLKTRGVLQHAARDHQLPASRVMQIRVSRPFSFSGHLSNIARILAAGRDCLRF
jgi:hypothetical protein